MLRNTALASQARAPRSQALHQQRSTQARGRTLHVCAAAHPQRRSRSPQDGLKKSSATKTGAASATAASPTAAARRSPPSSGAGEEEEDDDDEPMPAAYTVRSLCRRRFLAPIARELHAHEREKQAKGGCERREEAKGRERKREQDAR